MWSESEHNECVMKLLVPWENRERKMERLSPPFVVKSDRSLLRDGR